jgi:flagellar motor component MotA
MMTKRNVLGLFFLLAVPVLVCLLNGVRWTSLINVVGALAVLVGTKGALLLANASEKPVAEQWRLTGIFAWQVGIFTAILGLIAVLTHLDEPSAIGPNIAVGLLSVLYGALLQILCEALSARHASPTHPGA